MTTAPHRLTSVLLSGVALLALVVTACGPRGMASGQRLPSQNPNASPAVSPEAARASPVPSPSPLAGDVWERVDPGLAAVAQAGLMRGLSLSDTHDGATVTFERAYADANRIVIGYYLRMPEALGDRNAISADLQATLVDSAGRFYIQGSGGGVGEERGPLYTHILSFDAAPLPAGVPEATFDLTFPEVTGFNTSTKQMEVLARGPWRFHLTLPVQPGRVIDQPQAITVAGNTVRLERVVITPSLTRVWVRISPPDGDRSRHWVPMIDLDGPASVLGGARGSAEVPPDSGLFNSAFSTPPDPSGTTWKVQVSELVGMKTPLTPAAAPQQRRIAGPWIVAFVIPADPGVTARQGASPSGAPTAAAGDAQATLERFMQARLEREHQVVQDLLADNPRALDGQEQARRQLTQVSNPCWYRYAILAFVQPTPTSATALVRVYTHFWAGDVMGGLPRSWEQELGLSSTATGWRVERVEAPQGEREEPNEPHGRTTSVCTVPRVPTPQPAETATPVRQ